MTPIGTISGLVCVNSFFPSFLFRVTFMYLMGICVIKSYFAT